MHRMAAEVCDLPGHGDGETGVHHSMADGEAAGMNRGGVAGVVGTAVRGEKEKRCSKMIKSASGL